MHLGTEESIGSGGRVFFFKLLSIMASLLFVASWFAGCLFPLCPFFLVFGMCLCMLVSLAHLFYFEFGWLDGSAIGMGLFFLFTFGFYG